MSYGYGLTDEGVRLLRGVQYVERFSLLQGGV